jgi:hypothetical protein
MMPPDVPCALTHVVVVIRRYEGRRASDPQRTARDWPGTTRAGVHGLHRHPYANLGMGYNVLAMLVPEVIQSRHVRTS